jgi:colicin import membrane protein
MASSSKGRASARKRSSAGKARVISTKRKDALPRTGSVSAGRRKAVVLPPIDALTEPLATAVAARKEKVGSLHQNERTATRKKATRAAGRASAKLDELTAMEIAQALAALEPVMVTALEPVADTVAAVERPATAYEELAVTAPEVSEVEALGLVETELDMNAFALVEEVPPAGAAEAPALIAPALEPAMGTALEPIADTVAAVERPATAYEEFAVTALEATEVEELAAVESELEVDASAILEELIEAVTAQRIAVGPPPIPEETRARPLARTTAQSLTPAPHDEKRSRMPAISRLLSTLSRWTGVSGSK